MELSVVFASLSFMSTGVSVHPRELLVCTGSSIFSDTWEPRAQETKIKI